MQVDIVVNDVTPVIDVEVANRAGGISGEVIHDDTLIGDGSGTLLGVNTDIIATKDHVQQALAELPKFSVKIVDVLPEIGEEQIIYLVPKEDSEAPDVHNEYIWINGAFEFIGNTAVDLTDYVKNTDYVKTTSAGLVNGTQSALGITANSAGQLFINLATDTEIDNKYSKYRPIVPANLDYAVKTGVTTNTIELTDDEKASARTWLGAVGKADYPTAYKAGVISLSGNYGLNVIPSTGGLYATECPLIHYHNQSKYMFISKGTLENIKNDYVKRGITENDIELTEEEKTNAQSWLGVDTLVGDINSILDNINGEVI